MSYYPYPLEYSRFWRDWCAICSCPIRVPKTRVGLDNYCEKCDGHKPPVKAAVITPRQRHHLVTSEAC